MREWLPFHARQWATRRRNTLRIRPPCRNGTDDPDLHHRGVGVAAVSQCGALRPCRLRCYVTKRCGYYLDTLLSWHQSDLLGLAGDHDWQTVPALLADLCHCWKMRNEPCLDDRSHSMTRSRAVSRGEWPCWPPRVAPRKAGHCHHSRNLPRSYSAASHWHWCEDWRWSRQLCDSRSLARLGELLLTYPDQENNLEQAYVHAREQSESVPVCIKK